MMADVDATLAALKRGVEVTTRLKLDQQRLARLQERKRIFIRSRDSTRGAVPGQTPVHVDLGGGEAAAGGGGGGGGGALVRMYAAAAHTFFIKSMVEVEKEMDGLEACIERAEAELRRLPSEARLLLAEVDVGVAGP